MNDLRLGAVRLDLPDGRSLRLSITYERLDLKGHGWVIERLEVLQKGKAGSSRALADLLEVFSGGTMTADEVMAAPVTDYPLRDTTKAIYAAWELAFHGPGGKKKTEGKPDPQSRRPTLLSKLFGRR